MRTLIRSRFRSGEIAARAGSLLVLGLVGIASWAEAQPANRLLNPEFDDVLAPWVSSGGLAAVDADDCPGSGSANVPFSLPFLNSYVAQCVEVSAGETLHASMRALSSRALVAGLFRFVFQSGPGCTGDELETIDSELTPLDTTWIRFHGSAVVPAGAASVGVLVSFGSVLSSAQANIWADRAWLGSQPLLFFDGFENNATCRWSATIAD